MTSDIQTYRQTYILPLVVLSAALQQITIGAEAAIFVPNELGQFHAIIVNIENIKNTFTKRKLYRQFFFSCHDPERRNT